MKRWRVFCALALCLASSHAAALDILLSNDDGYTHANIRALYTALKAAGHNVRIAAPLADQSARGGAFFFGREVTIGHDSDPDYPDSYYVATQEQGLCSSTACTGQKVSIEISGTPVMAVLMGLKKVMSHPDLLIVGPNPGNNLGTLNSASGTFNAASVGVQAGIPSLAVSTDLNENNPTAVAQIVVRLVAALERQRPTLGALLPAGIGLNVNLPPLGTIKGLKQTQVGSYTGFEPVWSDDLRKFGAPGKPGIGFQYSPAATAADQDNEAVWVAKGYVTVSPFTPAIGRVAVDSHLQALISNEASALKSLGTP